MRLTYINVLKLLNAIEKTQTIERVPGRYSQDVVGVHPELGADVGGLVPPLARLLVHHLRHHLDTVRGSGQALSFQLLVRGCVIMMC